MEHILPLAAAYDLLPANGLILCALSGGGDSVALVHFLHTRGYRVAAAHYNHHLRPAAGEDARLARALCEELGVPFYYGEGEVAARRGNTEANAREMRYAFLRETAAAIGADRIATAHTASDNLETLLLHLTRGCGLKGLTGISPRRGALVRPMLHTTRQGVEEYLTANGLAYATDETNFDTRYARNRLRQQVVPVLESLNPKVTEVSARMMDALRADEDLLTALALEGKNDPALPPPLRYRAGPREEKTLPPMTPVELLPGERGETPLWTLETRRERAADAPPTPDRYYLKASAAQGPILLRRRRAGDFIHPPFRTGKTVKKWHNELGVPPGLREAFPIVELKGRAAAGAGIGPQRDLLAEPGEDGVLFQWTKNF